MPELNTHTYIHVFMHAHIHSHVHKCPHSYIHTYTQTHIHARMHSYIHTHTHTCTHTYIHTYTIQLMGIEIDTKYGGAGSTFFASILTIEELAKVDPSVSVLCDVQNTLIYDCFERFCSQELQEKYFPRLATDLVSIMASGRYELLKCGLALWWAANSSLASSTDHTVWPGDEANSRESHKPQVIHVSELHLISLLQIGSYCLSEPHCGADAFALRTSAKKDGNHWVLNGQKSWITNAEHAGVFIVFANIDLSKVRHCIAMVLYAFCKH